jgi:hypothetical protein
MKSSAIKPCLTYAAVSDSGAHLRSLWTWDLLPIARRVERELGWSREFVLRVELEYRRFIALAVLEPADRLGMQGPVDEFWHQHILFTVDYHRFCRAVAGGYIHHAPHQAESPEGVGSYQRTLALLERHFDKVDEAVWPRIGANSCNNCASCDKIGEQEVVTRL